MAQRGEDSVKKENGLLFNALTFLFLWAFLRFLVVTDIDRITKNWKHTKLILLLRAHDKVSIFDVFLNER